MIEENQNNLCIIPARGGSKRIPRKNIKDFLGKPIIAYSIEVALSSGLFDEVMVSTDDNEIAKVAQQYGAKVPFMRSSGNANDFATLADVLLEVVTAYSKKERYFTNICCILPTAPLVTSQRLTQAYSKLEENNLDSVIPVVEFSYPIYRALEFNETKHLKMIWPEHSTTRSQDIKSAYHDSGSFYWIKSNCLEAEKTLFCKKSGGIIVPEIETQDIDSKTDWQLAEMKYKLIK